MKSKGLDDDGRPPIQSTNTSVAEDDNIICAHLLGSKQNIVALGDLI